MNTYEIKYRTTKGSVRATRVSANSACQAAFAFLEDYDLPVLSVTRTDLLYENPIDMEMKLYHVIGESCKDTIFANTEDDARGIFKKMYGGKVESVRFLRYATDEEFEIIAGGGPHPRH